VCACSWQQVLNSNLPFCSKRYGSDTIKHTQENTCFLETIEVNKLFLFRGSDDGDVVVVVVRKDRSLGYIPSGFASFVAVASPARLKDGKSLRLGKKSYACNIRCLWCSYNSYPAKPATPTAATAPTPTKPTPPAIAASSRRW